MPFYSEVSSTEIKTMLEDKDKGEGNVNHMYLDKDGNVTVGIGHFITSAEEAAKLEFFVVQGKLFRDKYGNLKPENKSPDFRDKKPSDEGDSREVKEVQKATPEQIKNEYNKVNNLQSMKDKTPDKLKEKISLFMSDAAIFLLFQKKQKAIVDELKRRLGSRKGEGLQELKCYPPQAQLALINIMYGTGGGGLFGQEANPEKNITKREGFPKLLCALRVRDWKNVGDESSVKKFQDKRNIANRARFKSVIEIDRAKLTTEAKRFEKYSSLPKEVQAAVTLMTKAAGGIDALKKDFKGFVDAIKDGDWEAGIKTLNKDDFSCKGAGPAEIIKPILKDVEDLLKKAPPKELTPQQKQKEKMEEQQIRRDVERLVVPEVIKGDEAEAQRIVKRLEIKYGREIEVRINI